MKVNLARLKRLIVIESWERDRLQMAASEVNSRLTVSEEQLQRLQRELEKPAVSPNHSQPGALISLFSWSQWISKKHAECLKTIQELRDVAESAREKLTQQSARVQGLQKLAERLQSERQKEEADRRQIELDERFLFKHRRGSR